MAREKLCGIYKIENTVNGKVYIGQSVDIYKRWHEHKKRLNEKSHVNNYLQSAWNKHGEDAFTFEILECCERNSLNEKEIQYIIWYKSFGLNGYNLTAGGDGNLEWIQPEHVRLSHAKSVILLNTLEVFQCINDAERQYNIYATSISLCCRGISTYAGQVNNQNAVWMFYDDYLEKEYSLDDIQEIISASQMRKFDTRKVACVTTGKIYDSTAEAANVYNLSISGINSCLIGRTRYCGNYNGEKLIWRYLDEYVKLTDKDIEDLKILADMPVNNKRSKKVICVNTLQIYESIVAAGKDIGISYSTIVGCCTGKNRSAGKINGSPLIWMYLDDYLKTCDIAN